MSLEQKINDEIKVAMRAKDSDKLDALRAVKSAILLAKTSKGGGDELSEDQEIKLLSKLAKQRRESAQLYREQNRADLAETEEKQLTVIEQYLPEQLSEEELTTTVQQIIQQLGASSMADMGKVMGAASKQLAGKADGKAISAIVKQLLST